MSYDEYYQNQLQSDQIRIIIERNAWRSGCVIYKKTGKAKDGVRLADLLSISSLMEISK